jgi:hypothetical protein
MNNVDIIEWVTIGYFTMSDIHENPGVLIPFIFYACMELFILIGVINLLISIL